MEFILNDFDYLIRGRAESTLLARRGYLFIGSIWVCCGSGKFFRSFKGRSGAMLHGFEVKSF